MHFTKMQGLGNDYVYIDCTHDIPPELPVLARAVSEQHFGVGSDGMICICASEKADFQMRMFNADGSEGETCGNGIRCVGKFVYDKGLTDKTSLTIETVAGVRRIQLWVTDGKVDAVTVDMGQPKVETEIDISIKGKSYTILPVSMGNPHAVAFLEKIDTLDLPKIGPGFENHPIFPQRTNTEFVEVLDRTHLRMRVWERGSGETLACGTGACAVLAAAVQKGVAERTAEILLQGGTLHIRWDENDGHIYMTGPAVTVFEGEWPT